MKDCHTSKVQRPGTHCARAIQRILLTAIAAAALFCAAPVSVADETDQYTLPADKTFADLGPYLTFLHHKVLTRVVDDTNRRIERALSIRNERRREQALRRLHDPVVLADGVRRQFGPGFFEMRAVEHAFHTTLAAKRFPDADVVAWRQDNWLYSYTHALFDLRNIVLMFKGSTVRAYDVYFGTDKFGHFHDLGHIYYKHLRNLMREGWDEDDALHRVVQTYSRGPISEAGLVGFIATGVFSNADLASNYSGMLFYRNLGESVMIGDQKLPPLVVRIGDFWALNEHVRPESDFMQPFFTDHWNEALNPNLYDIFIRDAAERRVRDIADQVLEFYTEKLDYPRCADFFREYAEELATLFGADYGHSGLDDRLFTLGDVCFPEDDTDDEAGAEQRAGVTTPGVEE